MGAILCSGGGRGGPWNFNSAMYQQFRKAATASQQAPPAAAASSSSNGGSRLRWGLLVVVKSLTLWAPAILFWVQVVLGEPLLDWRTDEEIQEEENEMRRLERFFDVEGLPEEKYTAEWTNKDEALSQIVDKLLRSPKVMEVLDRGPDDVHPDLAPDTSFSPLPNRHIARQGTLEASIAAVEVSYVVPPASTEDGDLSQTDVIPGLRQWKPRLLVAHGSGALALATFAFEYVEKGKNREERWACTALRCELVATYGGSAASEPLCDLHGPVPHGVRYMRI